MLGWVGWGRGEVGGLTVDLGVVGGLKVGTVWNDWSGLQLGQEERRSLERSSKEALGKSGEKRKLRRLGFYARLQREVCSGKGWFFNWIEDCGVIW